MSAAETAAVLVVLVVPALLGVRSSRRLWRRYLYDEASRASSILLALAVVSTIITVAAAYFGVLSVGRILGFVPPAWAAVLSLAVSAAVLFIPAGLDWLATRIERRDGDDD